MRASVTIHNSGGPAELLITKGREILRRQKVRGGAEVAVILKGRETIRLREFREDEQYHYTDDTTCQRAVWQAQPLLS